MSSTPSSRSSRSATSINQGYNLDKKSMSFSPSDILDMLKEDYLYVFFLGALAVSAIVVVMARSKAGKEFFDSLNFSGVSWVKGASGNLIIAGLLVACTLLAAWACGSLAAHHSRNGASANLAMIIFAVLICLIVAMAYCFYRVGNFDSTRALSFAVVAVSFILTYLCWSVKESYGYAMIPLLAFSTLMAYIVDTLKKHNANKVVVTPTPTPTPTPSNP